MKTYNPLILLNNKFIHISRKKNISKIKYGKIVSK